MLFEKLFQSVQKFIVISCDAVCGTSDRFKEARRTQSSLSAGRRAPISDPLSSRTRTVVEPPFVAHENWGARGLMNILWMHISRHHGITRCRRVPDKAPLLKNGLLTYPMSPWWDRSRRRLGITFSLFRALRPSVEANLHLTLRYDGNVYQVVYAKFLCITRTNQKS